MPPKPKMYVVPPPDGSAKREAERQKVRLEFARERAKIIAKLEPIPPAENWPVVTTLAEFGQRFIERSLAGVARAAPDAEMQRELMRTFILNLRENIKSLARHLGIEPAERCDDDPFKEYDLICLWYGHACLHDPENGKATTSSEPADVAQAKRYFDFAIVAAAEMMKIIDARGQTPVNDSAISEALTYFMDHAESLRRLRDRPYTEAAYFHSAGDYLLIRALTRELVSYSRLREIENEPIATLDSRLRIAGPFIAPEPKCLKMRESDDPFWGELAAAEAWVLREQASLRGALTEPPATPADRRISAANRSGVDDELLSLDDTDLAILRAGLGESLHLIPLAQKANRDRRTISERLKETLIPTGLMGRKDNKPHGAIFTTAAGKVRLAELDKDSPKIPQ
ncbi:MAG: hypothetical protein ABSH22_21790 [Tepidisphaeraceae bacterium]|jgi:hypothetical protein